MSKIDLDKFKKMRKYQKEINAMNYQDIEILGVDIPQKMKESWKYVGLNNCSYIDMLIDEDSTLTWQWEEKDVRKD